MGVAGGTFAAAKFVAAAWREAKQNAASRGYREWYVHTAGAAALLAADWLMEADPQAARELIAAGDAHLHATFHDVYYVVSITSSARDELLIVMAKGGAVTSGL
jgi:hypothetical protein